MARRLLDQTGLKHSIGREQNAWLQSVSGVSGAGDGPAGPPPAPESCGITPKHASSR